MKHTLTRSSVDTLLNGLDGLNGISRGDGEQRHCWVKEVELLSKEVVWVVGMREKQKEGKTTLLIYPREKEMTHQNK